MHTLILAGGSGTRLFPLSRGHFPKQFLPIFDGHSLYQLTLRRALIFSSPEEIVVVTNPDQEFIARDQAGMIGCGCRILSEPEGKNTLPAVYYGLREIEQSSGPAKVAVLPSDHMVHAGPVYADALRKAEELADKWLVLFGVKGTEPHTGYGYIQPGPAIGGAYSVSSFTEKPDRVTAERYLQDGYLWNSGMFLFSTRLFFEECGIHAPDIARAFTRPLEEAYREVPSVSIDYGLMEKTSRAAVVPLETGWNDLGSFDAFYSVLQKNGEENAVRGEYIGLDSTGNLVIGDHLVITIGVHDTAIIDSGDVTLIAPRQRAHEAKEAVALLRQKGDPRADSHLTEYRPWGSYTRLEDGPSYRIKRITVPQGRRLSLQMHHHRSEHWVVVHGTAKVHIDGQERLLRKGESTFVPIGAVHRLENPGLVPLEIIEVQIGEYIGEDDIVRLQDDYQRHES
ncbi:MAG TPA: mannose-1-phosphate guanylyltransferase/mannose-6-phosphate isomerase [Methanoregulaceae archaeon]|nr:mannose-1-phosphate guanylyltransferase/mannose-6-phosphate isomerase [Methanoregulaceae archaeon]HOB59903.1 mannose-1-phosphate guanylyltransferase/mannose-6-phosphate isomerase [Methanoregulaceae archaeon]